MTNGLSKKEREECDVWVKKQIEERARERELDPNSTIDLAKIFDEAVEDTFGKDMRERKF